MAWFNKNHKNDNETNNNLTPAEQRALREQKFDRKIRIIDVIVRLIDGIFG